jgi:protein TonB
MTENSNIPHLFDRSGNLTLDTMARYLKGELTPAEKTLVEKHLESSAFDREALEGLSGMQDSEMTSDVASLQAMIHKKARDRRALRSRKVKYYWAAAAGLLAVLSITTVLLFTFRNTIQPEQLALANQDTLIPEEIAPIDLPAGRDTLRALPDEEEINEKAIPEEDNTLLDDDEEAELDEKASRPPVTMQINMVEDDIEVHDEFAIESRQTEVPPVIGGVAAKDEAGGLAGGKERRANYTIQAEQVMKMPEEEEYDEENQLFMVVESMPEFPGGEKALQEYLKDNLQYPESAKEAGIQGRVFVTFVVESDGTIRDVKVLRGIGGGCDEEAVRVVKEMPEWKPGMQRGKPVRVQYNLPIKFTLP